VARGTQKTTWKKEKKRREEEARKKKNGERSDDRFSSLSPFLEVSSLSVPRKRERNTRSVKDVTQLGRGDSQPERLGKGKKSGREENIWWGESDIPATQKKNGELKKTVNPHGNSVQIHL